MDDHIDKFANLTRRIMDQTRELTKNASNWQHPDAHDFFLKLISNSPQMYDRLKKLFDVTVEICLNCNLTTELLQMIAIRNQFPHQVHEIIHALHIHAYR